MSNFDFILNLDNSKRITNNDNNLCYDNSYISYFRNLSLEEPLVLIRNTLLKKIIEKEFIYKNSEYLEQINNCIDYCLTNLKNINEHKIYIKEEIQQIDDLVEFIKNENSNINSLIQSKLKSTNKNKEKDNESEDLENINEDNILLNENNSRNINEDNYSENNYNLCEKVFSIAIKVKNAIQMGFKVSYNFISLHSKNLINRFRN